MDVVSVVEIAEKSGGDDGRTEADPAVKKIAANAVKMRRRESWECILDEIIFCGPGKKKRMDIFLVWLVGYEKLNRNLGNTFYLTK